MLMATYSHVFGPVPSRRLGRSLGIDLVPFKTCTYDCVYCQLGRTTTKTLSRREYVPSAEVLHEVEGALRAGPLPDYITLAGSGGPTLFEPLGDLIRGLKRLTDVPVAVLTNGSLLWLPEVRAGLAEADLAIPSLDAGNEVFFQLVNRPHPDLHFADITSGLVQFGREFRGRIWLEVFLLAGLTAASEQVWGIGEVVRRVRPERVQLNTIARPPAESWTRAASPEELAAAQAVLGEHCEVVIDAVATPEPGGVLSAGEDAVLALLRRRPCRLEDLSAGLGLHRNEVLKYLGHLRQTGQIGGQTLNQQTYYTIVAR